MITLFMDAHTDPNTEDIVRMTIVGPSHYGLQLTTLDSDFVNHNCYPYDCSNISLVKIDSDNPEQLRQRLSELIIHESEDNQYPDGPIRIVGDHSYRSLVKLEDIIGYTPYYFEYYDVRIAAEDHFSRDCALDVEYYWLSNLISKRYNISPYYNKVVIIELMYYECIHCVAKRLLDKLSIIEKLNQVSMLILIIMIILQISGIISSSALVMYLITNIIILIISAVISYMT